MPRSVLYYGFSGRDLPDYSRKSFNSMWVENGRVKEIGFGLEEASRFSGVPRVDLEGKVILPAFADAHVHWLQTGLDALSVDLHDCADLNEVFSRLQTAVADAGDGWVTAGGFDETRLREARLPTSAELDRLLPARSQAMLWISRVDLHSALASTRARQWLAVPPPGASPPPPIPKEGLIKNQGYWYGSARVAAAIAPAAKRAGMARVERRCLELGVSTVHALEGGALFGDRDLGLVADYAASSPLNLVIYHQSPDPSEAVRRGWPRFGGCLLVDGSFGSRTAWLRQPYADDVTTRGELYLDRDALKDLVGKAAEHDLQLALHCIGDAAIDVVTQVHHWHWQQRGPGRHAHRLEHFELPTNHAMDLAREANLLISVQPAFELAWGGLGGMYERRLGSPRVWQTNPFKTMMGRGLPLAGGSDSPVTPIDPWAGVHGFVNHPNDEERIDLNSALAAFILEPHRFSGQADVRGRLQPGFVADFVALERDPFLVPPARLRHLTIDRLYLRGVPIEPTEGGQP